MARLRRQKTALLREIIGNNDRCLARHPNWHGARCEQRRTDHIVHSSEQGELIWTDIRQSAEIGAFLQERTAKVVYGA
jgi:hypothetical protein